MPKDFPGESITVTMLVLHTVHPHNWYGTQKCAMVSYLGGCLSFEQTTLRDCLLDSRAAARCADCSTASEMMWVIVVGKGSAQSQRCEKGG
jgi:hypothetical protein